jgi:hypothetical protein
MTSATMVAPGGWRVVPITVERGGRTLRLYRVTRSGRFVCECRSPDEVATAGAPLDQLVEEEPRQTPSPPA